tara:strand:- start:195 stop:407 length:213 start_codon:yes stop_codon:yes gene_type:complete
MKDNKKIQEYLDNLVEYIENKSWIFEPSEAENIPLEYVHKDLKDYMDLMFIELTCTTKKYREIEKILNED